MTHPLAEVALVFQEWHEKSLFRKTLDTDHLPDHIESQAINLLDEEIRDSFDRLDALVWQYLDKSSALAHARQAVELESTDDGKAEVKRIWFEALAYYFVGKVPVEDDGFLMPLFTAELTTEFGPFSL